MSENLLFSKVYGCIFGSVVGNALGVPLEEFGDYRLYGRVTDFVKDIPEMCDDDVEYLELYCKAYIEKGSRISPEDMARVWTRDAFYGNMFYCLQTSMELVKNGVPARYSGVGNCVTGSAIMGIAPVGLFHACNPADAYIDALDLSFMHQRGLDAEAAAVYAACTAEAMKPRATVSSVLDTAIEFSSDTPMIIFDTSVKETFRGTIGKALDIAAKYTDVFEARPELIEKCTQWHQLDPLEVLTLTLAMFKVADGDPTNAIIGGANIGRDADTIPSLAGALAGALNGYQKLPKHLVQRMSEHTKGKYEALAKGMCRVISSNADVLEEQMHEYREFQKEAVR
ncbi:MAG: ADP-ribosylglycohydrolase family protein [Armatimonadetes bacterium]|nr:ADP-ribosylglycohydrolase family protein [Armatimonadota bacterium]